MVKQVAIAGAGPAGLLLAHYLLRRGDDKYKIDIYERRSDPREVTFSKERTYPISLFERGLSALRAVPGLEETVKAKGTQIKGSLAYQENGKTIFIPRNTVLTLIDRTRLTIAILERLENEYKSDQVKIHFNSKLSSVDFENNIGIIEQKNQETINYDILVGADGAKSVVREHLKNTENFQCEEKYLPNKYKTLFLNSLNENGEVALDRELIHSFRMDNGMTIMIIPQPAKTFSSVVGFDLEKNPVVPEFLNSGNSIEFIAERFPKVAKLITEKEAEAFLERPLSNIVTISCNRFHQGNNVIVIGDAAHAISPALGQGCNCALEDVVILDKLLDEYKDDWAAILPQFTSCRLPDIIALQEMSNYAFPKSKLLFFELIFRRKMNQIIKKIFPKYRSNFLYDNLETTISYSKILEYSQNWVNKVKKSNQKLLKSKEQTATFQEKAAKL